MSVTRRTKVARCPQCNKKTRETDGLSRGEGLDSRGEYFGLSSIHHCDHCDVDILVTEKWRFTEFECELFDG